MLKHTREFLKSPKVTADDADVATALADFLGAHASAKSIDWCQKVGNDLAKHAIPEIAAASGILLGTAKRLGVVGKSIQLKGTTTEGKPFDLSQFKDKVVLIEFWATWCPHCVDELPVLKQCYEGYHAKGFEIVGISSDEELQTLKDFLKFEQLAWINLHETGGKHPALDEFGISAFPSNFLIGKDGKVVAIDLRDMALSEQLKKVLGDPEAGKEITEDLVPKDSKAKPRKRADDTNDDGDDSPESLKKKYTF
jgi:thiol-disulfide isomerase/thioredoxin